MASQDQYGVYQQAQQNVSEMDQLLMLYDGAINILRQAIKAIEEENYQERWNLINRVCAIVGGLTECLNFEEGGETATALKDFYYSVDARLISVHHNNRIDICKTVIEDLTTMRNAWQEVARQANKADKTEQSVKAQEETSVVIGDENTDSGSSSTHISA